MHRVDLQTKQRNRRFRSAIASSIFSKIGSLLVQILALPVAISGLGPRLYGAYASTVASVSWVTFISVGSGPSLTRRLARAVAADDAEQEAVLFTNGLVAVLVAATIVCAALLAFLSLGLEAAIGPATRGYSHEVKVSLSFLCALVPLAICGSLADAMYAGYQEQVVTNLWSFVSSLASLPLYFYVQRVSPTIPAMVVATFAPPAATRLIALAQLVFFRRSHLRFRWKLVNVQMVRGLFIDSGVFAIISVGSYLNTQLAVLVAGRHGAGLAAQMAILMQIYALLISVAVMINNTLWPALIEARQRNDISWTRRAIKLAVLANLLFALASLVGLGLFGDQLALRWYKIPLSQPKAAAWAMGIYMFFFILENLLISLCVGVGRLGKAATIFACRSATVAVLYPVLITRGIPTLLVASALSIVLGPSLLMVQIVRESLRDYRIVGST